MSENEVKVDHTVSALGYLDSVRTKTDAEALQKAQVHALLAIAEALQKAQVKEDSSIIIDHFPKVNNLMSSEALKFDKQPGSTGSD